MAFTTEDGKPCEGIDQGPFEPIAIVGLGALMPDASSMMRFGRTFSMPRSASDRCPKGGGRGRSTTFGRKVAQEPIRKGSPMRKLERWSPMLNLIGDAGGSLRAPYRKLTPVSNGP